MWGTHTHTHTCTRAHLRMHTDTHTHKTSEREVWAGLLLKQKKDALQPWCLGKIDIWSKRTDCTCANWQYRQAFSSHGFIIAWQPQWVSGTVTRKSSAFAATFTTLLHIFAQIAYLCLTLYGHCNNHTSWNIPPCMCKDVNSFVGV